MTKEILNVDKDNLDRNCPSRQGLAQWADSLG